MAEKPVEFRTRRLKVDKEGNTNYYQPAVDEGHAPEEEVREFLEDSPTVTREQAVAALEEAGEPENWSGWRRSRADTSIGGRAEVVGIASRTKAIR